MTERIVELEKRIAELETRLTDGRELTIVALRAAISALAGLEAAVKSIDASRSVGMLSPIFASEELKKARNHADRGLEILRVAIEDPTSVG